MDLGKLIHDSESTGSRPMIVYRLHKYRPSRGYYVGPYRVRGQGLKTMTSPARPHPLIDFPREDYKELMHGKDTLLFGFRKPEDAKTWFGPDFEKLIAMGFTLDPVPASRVWLSDTKRQLFFLPDYRDPRARKFGPKYVVEDEYIEKTATKPPEPLIMTLKKYRRGRTTAILLASADQRWRELGDLKPDPRSLFIDNLEMFPDTNLEDAVHLLTTVRDYAKKHGYTAIYSGDMDQAPVFQALGSRSMPGPRGPIFMLRVT
jgi:hypothetical protein